MTFNKEQLDRLFPFYILINAQLAIEDIGNSLRGIYRDCKGESFPVLFHVADMRARHPDFLALRSRSGQPVTLEFFNPDKISVNVQFEYLEASDQMLFTGSPYLKPADIKLKRQKDEELHRLSLFATTNESGVVYNNDKGEIIWVNEAFCKMIGYPKNEIIGKNTLEFCTGPLTENNILHAIVASIGKLESFDEELIHYRKDGSWFWGRVKGNAYQADEKKPFQYFAIVEDITLEKEKEERLEVLSQIAESNVNAVIITDKRGRITWVNKSFTQTTGYSLDEVAGRKPGRLLQGPETSLEAIKYLRERIMEGKAFSTEIYNYPKSLQPYWIRIQGQPFCNSNGDFCGFFAIQENITRKKANCPGLIPLK